MSLHSNLVLFKWWWEETFIRCQKLYIPIWFYSNGKPCINVQFVKIFTFQSGSIQIFLNTSIAFAITPFTFQSGSIQIILSYLLSRCCSIFTFQSGSIQIFPFQRTFLRLYYPLHSNLVLFKSADAVKEQINKVALHSNLVLFKQGLRLQRKLGRFLYIPIWFYSN